MIMKIAQIPVGSMLNFSYIVYDEKNSIGAIIDPSWDLEKLLVFLEKNNITVKYIINTHTHFDHILGNDHISEITKAKIIQHEKYTQKKGRSVVDHENISIGELNLEVLYTRVDLPGSNPEKMYDSLSKVANLDDSLVVYPGHNYGSTPISTILNEKTNNPMLNFKTKEAFLKYMVNED